MTDDTKVTDSHKSRSKFNTVGSLKFLMIFFSIIAVLAGFFMGLQIFESLAEFKRLGVFIIFGSILGAVILLALVKVLNDLSYIKNKLDGKS